MCGSPDFEFDRAPVVSFPVPGRTERILVDRNAMTLPFTVTTIDAMSEDHLELTYSVSSATLLAGSSQFTGTQLSTFFRVDTSGRLRLTTALEDSIDGILLHVDITDSRLLCLRQGLVASNGPCKTTVSIALYPLAAQYCPSDMLAVATPGTSHLSVSVAPKLLLR